MWRIISKGTFQMQIKKKKDLKNQHMFAETFLYEAVVLEVSVIPSLLPHVFWQNSQVFPFLGSVVRPAALKGNNFFGNVVLESTREYVNGLQCSPLVVIAGFSDQH